MKGYTLYVVMISSLNILGFGNSTLMRIFLNASIPSISPTTVFMLKLLDDPLSYFIKDCVFVEASRGLKRNTDSVNYNAVCRIAWLHQVCQKGSIQILYN